MTDNPISLNTVDDAMVSIIVATLNSGASLQDCIDSVTSQSHKNRELIVIDGGSTDHTVDILTANNHSIDYWESVPDQGIYDAWNKGLSHASGDWVCFLGSDDVLAQSDTLRHLLSKVQHDVILVTGKALIKDEEGRPIRDFGSPWDWKKMKRSQCVTHSGSLIRRSKFARIGQFNTSFRIAGDYEFLLRLGKSTNSQFLDETVVIMREGGMSRSGCYAVTREKWRIQSSHPEIGIMLASIYCTYSLAHCLISKFIK